jgi:hypothetical protein
MIDSRLNIPTFEADFEDVVDSIRQTGTITGLVALNGETTIQTVNDLKLNDVITVGGVSCKVLSFSGSEIVVNKEVSGSDWKAEFPYFMDGHLIEIQSRLKDLDDSGDNVLKYSKYPLVVLLQNIRYDKNKINKSSVSIDFLVVNETEGKYITKQRRDYNFTPIIDPIYNELIGAIKDSLSFTITNNDFGVSREYYWGSDLANKNPLSDRLDAIEVSNLKLELTIKNCK